MCIFNNYYSFINNYENKEKKEENINANKEAFLLKSNGVLAKKDLKLIDLGKGTYSNVFTVQNKTKFKIFCCKEILQSKIVDL